LKPSSFEANRNRKYSGKNTVTMKMDASAVNAKIDALLNSMVSGVEADVQKAVRPAAQAAAEVYYKQAVQNVAALGSKTGNLIQAIYQAFSKEKSVAAPGGGYEKATYHVSWRTSDAGLDDNGQPIRTGLPVAPHGHLIEFGWIQRYAVQTDKNGNWKTVVRSEHRKDKKTGKSKSGMKKPKRRASQAEKDAYYVLRPGGPVQHPARPFMRSAYTQAQDAAAEAAIAKILEVIGAKP